MRTGDLIFHRMRTSEATYEVVEVADGLVTVRVLDGPGLAPGSVHRFLREDVLRMERLEQPPLPESGGRFHSDAAGSRRAPGPQPARF